MNLLFGETTNIMIPNNHTATVKNKTQFKQQDKSRFPFADLRVSVLCKRILILVMKIVLRVIYKM